MAAWCKKLGGGEGEVVNLVLRPVLIISVFGSHVNDQTAPVTNELLLQSDSKPVVFIENKQVPRACFEEAEVLGRP